MKHPAGQSVAVVEQRLEQDLERRVVAQLGCLDEIIDTGCTAIPASYTSRSSESPSEISRDGDCPPLNV
jgi:hypothetical protein